MRTRLLRPELVTDELLGTLPDGLVLFYLKLWLLTDDAGFFEFRVRQIAATLYPYRSPARRLKAVEGWLGELVQLGRVELLACGVHGIVPTIPRHRIQGGSSAYTHRDHHAHKCRVRTSTDKYSSESDSESVSESESGRPGALSKTGTTLRERAQAILDDPGAAADAKEGARAMLKWAR